MEAIEERKGKERSVLRTLLQSAYAYKKLPREFSEDDFKIQNYRTVYVKFRERFVKTGKPANHILFQCENIEMIDLLDSIISNGELLNGRFFGEAKALMNNRLIGTAQNRNIILPQPVSYQGKIEQGFKFELLTGMEICSMQIPKQSFLIKNLISENSVNFLSGQEGCGKSLLAMNLAISIAIGSGKWLEFEIVKHGKVLYLNNELAFSDFAWRLKKMCDNLPASGNISNLIIPKEVPALSGCWDTLNSTCEKEKPCLIIVDTLYFTHDKDENDSSDMKALMRQFLSLRDTHNLALLLIHHTKKGARFEKMHNDQMRGSNVFSGVTDTVLQIRRSAEDETKRIIKPTKFRHVSDENRKCRLLSLSPETLWFRDEGETEESDHIARVTPTAEESIEWNEILKAGTEYSRKDIMEQCGHLGFDERTIDRLLRKAKIDGVLKIPKYGYYSL